MPSLAGMTIPFSKAPMMAFSSSSSNSPEATAESEFMMERMTVSRMRHSPKVPAQLPFLWAD